MEKKFSLTLDKEFIEYCELNNINDVEKYAKEVFNRGFMLIKYGDAPKITPLTEGKFKTNVKEIPSHPKKGPPPPLAHVIKKDGESLYDE